MGVSTRHTRRILAAYTEEGAAALAHGHRGRRAPNTTPDSIRAEVLSLARTMYSGVNHTHLSELLRERDGMDIARNTLRRILVGAGLVSPRRRRPPKHRIRRQRMPREGMLIQIDGSYHRWLGEDGPQFMLLLAVDDATGKVVSALFCEYENTRDYFMLMRGLIERSRGTHRAVHRPPLGLQARTGEWTTERSNPVLPCDGRVRNTDDLRVVPAGQGPCGTSGRDLPRQTCNRASTRGCDQPRGGQGRSERLPSSLQRALRGIGSGVCPPPCGRRDVSGSDAVLQAKWQRTTL